MKLFPLAIALALAMASTSALASSHSGHDANTAKPMPGMGCGMMGTDKMSPEDHQKKMDEMFGQMDANNDGSVTKAEFGAHHTKMMAKRQEMMKSGGPQMEHKH